MCIKEKAIFLADKLFNIPIFARQYFNKIQCIKRGVKIKVNLYNSMNESLYAIYVL